MTENRNQNHEGEPDLNSEAENWMTLPEENRERIEAYVRGSDMQLNDMELQELSRYLRWNLIHLEKIIEKEKKETTIDNETGKRLEGTLEMFRRAYKRFADSEQEKELHREQDN